MSIITYVFLALALVFLSFNKIKTSYLIFIISVFFAYYFKIINITFVVINIIAFGLALYYKYKKSLILELILFVFCIGLFLHFIPGINNIKVLDKVYASENSAPFTLYFNFDKPLGVFILFLLLPALFTNKNYVKASLL
ncbi:TPA: CPBP family intramembrane glutamic endopeptidase, partial [Campylobacter jejuni]